MSRLRRWWWLILIAVPVLTYAGLIIAAYIHSPIDIGLVSTGYIPQPTIVVEVVNYSRWPVTLSGVQVKGVLPPDEVGAFMNVGGDIAEVYSLVHPDYVKATGQLKGWRVGPRQTGVTHGIKLIWYQNADLRWWDCPNVQYRYLGWPMATHEPCSESLRAVSLVGSLPAGLGEWGPWQSVQGGLRFRTQRVTRDRWDDLWIEVEPDDGEPRLGFTLNRFSEEPAGGHARFRLRLLTSKDMPGKTEDFSVPLRWGEPAPEIQLEVIPLEEWNQTK